MRAPSGRPVLYFDGLCNLCAGAVQFVIKHDKKQRFLFASLQSQAGAEVLQKLPGSRNQPGTLVLQHNGNIYTRSDAALHIAGLLGGRWRWLKALLILPRFIRNAVYNLVSRNRYRWFGRRTECLLPTPKLKERFLH